MRRSGRRSIACGIVFLAGIGAAIYFIRGISKPLKDVHQALEAVADEDVSLTIPHTGMNNEVGMMAKATRSLQEKIRERHAMSEREAVQQLALESERENNLRSQRDEAAGQARVVATIGQALEKIARGDLTVRCADIGQKYAALRDNFNDALSHLEAAMAKVSAKGGDIGVSEGRNPPCIERAVAAHRAPGRKPGGNLGRSRRTHRRRPPDGRWRA